MTPKKRFGQNFLNQPAILQKMQEAILSTSPAHVLEIGPGQGALTACLMHNVKSITAIEIDKDLIAFLNKKFSDHAWNLIDADVLSVDLAALEKRSSLNAVVGNLPYNISTPFLIKYRDELPHIPGFFLVQKEVAERLTASPGTKDYGRLSVMMQRQFDMSMLFDVGPENFYPRPKVQSTFIYCAPHTRYPELPPLFEDVVREAFCYRRKMLKKGLERYKPDFEKAGIDPARRAETLSLEEFIRLATHAAHPDKLA